MEAALGPPTGTIAMLFTDIEGSTQRVRALGPLWANVLAVHHELVGGAIVAEGGWIDGTEGDAFFATFADPAAAGRAAVTAQRALSAHDWPAEIETLAVRMGLHVGHVDRAATGYVGLEVHRAARIAGAAHGGQLLLSAHAASLLGEVVEIESLGAHRLKDFPQPETLHCAVIDGIGAAAFPPPRTEPVRSTNLPPASTALIGREVELARLRAALIDEGERLVTVTGRGGAGKTTLALAAAAELLEDFPGGVWLVRLATVAAATEVAGTIASAVGATLATEGSPRAAVVARLRGRGRTLLVLDNFEHLLAAAEDVMALLAELPELSLLVTSQSPLRAGAELVVPIDRLDDEAALALVERVARRRNPAISVAGRDRETLVELVHLLDGLPLALEVAAARLALLSPAQLLARLRQSPDLLRDDRSDRPERQRSLRATVQWSLGLLDPSTRSLFARLGVFAGPVELEELELVCGTDGLDVIGELFRLLEVALIRRVEDGDGQVRFGLPEGLRRIAAEALDESGEGERWRRAHAERQRDIVWPVISVSVEESAHHRAVSATAERRIALRWAPAADRPLAQALAAGHAVVASECGELRDAAEWGEWLALETPATAELVVACALAIAWALITGDGERAIPHLERALAVAVAPDQRVDVLLARGLLLGFAGRVEEAVAANVQAVVEAESLGADVLAHCQMLEAQTRLFAADTVGARALLEQVGPVFERSTLAYRWKRFTVHGDVEQADGHPETALPWYVKSLEEAERRHNDLQIMFDLLGTATALAQCGADAGALELEAMLRTYTQELGGPGAHVGHVLGQAALGEARERLGPAGAEAAAARGRAVAPAERVVHACALAQAAALSPAADRSAPRPR